MMYRLTAQKIERFRSGIGRVRTGRLFLTGIRAASLLLAAGCSGGGDGATAGSGTAGIPPLDPVHEQIMDPEVYASASHILIRFAGSLGAGPEVARTRKEAKSLANRVSFLANKRGADFALLAREYSEETNARDTAGYLGIFGRGVMDLPFEVAVFALEPGQAGRVVETEHGFHVLKREEIRRAYLRHILIAWQGAERRSAAATRTREQAATLAHEVFLQASAEGADFCDLARRYSDDTDNRGNCGDLGMVYRSNLEPEVEYAGFHTRPGQVAEPVETSFGFHIVRREL